VTANSHPDRSDDPATTQPAWTSDDRPWLVMPTPATLDLADVLPGTIVVRNPGEFVRHLREVASRVAVIATPPAAAADVLAALAERRRRPDLRLVLVNAPDDIAGRLDALALGFDEAVPDTMDARELRGRIDLLLVPASLASAAHGATPLTIAPGLELDRLARSVRLEGRDVHLRPREYALLDALADEPGRVFPRAELIARVWGRGYQGSVRTVDVHVRWLRAKLEADPAKPVHVVTVRGTGYRLDCRAG
jgi:two-component system response regulator RegX3